MYHSQIHHPHSNHPLVVITVPILGLWFVRGTQLRRRRWRVRWNNQGACTGALVR
ncbi:hypothetical protein PILCRDRAFT_191272 [Piloderma croceum F 1598]|uniref:Uncharacterized protein n=1 Tax=Piloderma croceum (strain F 1598) TaxID=765440 RepID=A0A0C3GG36_PILCF|nr:hypothetical protein PILCRDRAFT_191272 [Piloderma croceum F 1598]